MSLKLSDEQAKALGIGNYIPKRVARPSGKNELGQNKLEARYDRRLADLKARGVIRDYWFESIKFRLGPRCYLTPDFVVAYDDGSTQIHETKGWWREDARAKTKMACEKYWHFRWIGVRWVNGDWEFEEIAGRKGG